MKFEICGETKVLGIIADPIHHVKTPQVLNRLFSDHELNATLVPIHVKSADLASVVQGLRNVENLSGFVVTVPHKQAIVEYCDELSDHAELTHSVNCVRRLPDGRLSGAILDGSGFVQGLEKHGHQVAGKRAYLAGAGGAASAIALALLSKGISALTVHNRTQQKAEELLSRLAPHFPDVDFDCEESSAASADLLVNATTLGMNATDPCPIGEQYLHPDQLVAEIIMEPSDTLLLKTARSMGCAIHPGLPMLTEQSMLMARHMGVLN